jgi:hypothetical protein
MEFLQFLGAPCHFCNATVLLHSSEGEIPNDVRQDDKGGLAGRRRQPWLNTVRA